MIYWVLDKQNDQPAAYGSLKVLSENTTLTLDSLYYHFTRQKRTSLVTDRYRVEKINLVRSARKN